MKLKNTINRNETKVSLFYRGLNPRPIWQSLVEAQIGKLRHLASIISARVTLEQLRHSKPGFRVFAILEVPGPDFHAEARDYTLRAALLKVINNLRRQMQSRKSHQVARLKNKARFAAVSGPARLAIGERAGARHLAPQANANFSRM